MFHVKRAAAAAVVAGLLLSGCGGAAPPTGQPYEVEDCDAEDYRNREADCGFVKKKTTSKRYTAPRKTVRRR